MSMLHSAGVPLEIPVKHIIRTALKPLAGLPLRQMNRSADLLSLHFGNPREIRSRDGEAKLAFDWTLQIQCPWRVSQGGRIVVAYRDFYFSDAPLKNVDVMNRNRFDTVVANLCAEFETTPPVVASSEADDSGGILIDLSQEYRFEAFPSESMGSGKCWRIFEPAVIQGRSFVFPPSPETS